MVCLMRVAAIRLIGGARPPWQTWLARRSNMDVPGVDLGKPVGADATPQHMQAAAFINPGSVEEKVAEQTLVNRAIEGDSESAVVHVGIMSGERRASTRERTKTFDPDATPAEKAIQASGGLLAPPAPPTSSSHRGGLGGSLNKLGSSGLGAVRKVGSTGLGTVQTVGTTGLGAVHTVGTTGLGAVHTIGSTGLGAVQTIGSVGVDGLATIGSVGVDGLGMIGSTGKSLLGAPAGKHTSNETARAVAVDRSTAASADVPTVDLEALNRASREEGQGVNGEHVAAAAAASSSKRHSHLGLSAAKETVVGWIQAAGGKVSGTTIADSTEQEARQIMENIFTDKIPKEFYGTAYHNAGIILFAVLTTRVITLFHMGWGWIAILLAVCMSFYSISIERTRHRARDDIQRELTKVRLVSETETADWINSLLDRAWLIAEPLLSATVIAMVDDILANSPLPPGLESIRMTTFTLGNKAPRIDSIRTYPKTPDDEIIMEWALSFTPNDLQDLTPREARGKVNPKIALSVRIGKGIVAAGLPILLEDISFVGQLRLKLKLMSNFPHVKTVQVSFMTKPDFDYVLKPLTAFDINSIPGLSSFIKDQVHAVLGPMMYDPNVFTINLEQLLSGNPLDSAIGVLRVTVDSARGLKAVKIGGGAPDPYVTLSLGDKAAVVRTKTVQSNSSPKWQEIHYIIVNSLMDSLALTVFDYNEHRVDNRLGTVSHDLSTLVEGRQENLQAKILSEGKDRGDIQYSLAYYPVLQPEILPDGTPGTLPDRKTGIARLTIHQAKDFDLSRHSGTLSAYARLYLGSGPAKQPIFKTPTYKHSNTPAWEASTEFLVTDKTVSQISIDVRDDKDLAKDALLGQCSVPLSLLLTAKDRQQDWYPLKGAGKIRLTLDWKPLNIEGFDTGAAAYVPPIGIMRILLKKAEGVKNVERGLEGGFNGKSDPYCRVLLFNRVLDRTEYIKNTLNPEWDTIVYAPVHSLQERLTLEVMDYQTINRDRSLGKVELLVSEYVTQAESGYTSMGTLDKVAPIQLGHGQGVKGRLFFEANFVPCVRLKGGAKFPPISNGPYQSSSAIGGTYAARKSSIRSTKTSSRTTLPSLAASSADITSTIPAAIPETGVLPTSSNTGEPGDDNQDSTPNSRDENDPSEEEEEEEEGEVMSKEELLKQDCGILVMQVRSAELAHKGRLEALLNGNYWPAFSTDRATSKSMRKWDEIGEVFVKEIDFSQIAFQLNSAEENTKEDVRSSVSYKTRELIEQSLFAHLALHTVQDHPIIIDLRSSDGSETSKIEICCKYAPVKITLEARESINSKGADRSGKSDPYVVFNLNGGKVFKSGVQKKTLTPKWNEHFEVEVPSRVGSHFELEVYDWNQLDNAKLLGTGSIDLAELEPFAMREMEVPLQSVKHGDTGTIRVRLVFTPAIIAKSRRDTTTFSQAGRAITTVGAVPLGVGKGVGKGVFYTGKGLIHGVGSTVGFAGRKAGLIKKKDRHGNEVLVDEHTGLVHEGPEAELARIPSEGTSRPLPTSAMAQALAAEPVQTPGVEQNSNIHEGKAEAVNITCVSASNLLGGNGHEVKPYVQLTLGRKSYKTGHAKRANDPEWNETFKLGLEENENMLLVKVLDHKTIGKDREIGQAHVDISPYIRQGAQATTQAVQLENTQAQVVLQFDPVLGTQVERQRTPSVNSKNGQLSASSPASKFSFRHRN
ncbi:hypothetical protein QFC19_002631 [Naganishia cerealis]|uniref:Uncharacterized protein n=1 Tax=Naganishia cerealis TaxID=610337 RepID=A0ACC2W821_9TREE|nr:hypothetical protein QFC19_002631 [Naganishia cerealis]